VGLSVSIQADGKRHMDDSFDQLGSLQLGHCLVAALKLSAIHAVAGLKCRGLGAGTEGRPRDRCHDRGGLCVLESGGYAGEWHESRAQSNGIPRFVASYEFYLEFSRPIKDFSSRRRGLLESRGVAGRVVCWVVDLAKEHRISPLTADA
jgi:hypothetical protein